ncbi:MAG TPA: ATP-binding protein, partial [Thermodesulfovibrionales bacterium]|nr:ATP-binding protein [Thermodesulfovibrionales bacterium]
LSSEDYVFCHDRIQEAAYSLIPLNRKIDLHYRIGSLALQQTRTEYLEERIFFVVNHLNIGESRAETQEERNAMARLNLLAGRKAKKSTAYGTADKYLKHGLDLLHPDAWENEYDLALHLHLEGGEARHLVGRHESAERILDKVLDRAVLPLDRAKVYEIRVDNYSSMYRYREAVKCGTDAVRMLGFELPEEARPEIIEEELAGIRGYMRNAEVEDLIDLPEMTDPEKIAVSRILQGCTLPAYVCSPPHFIMTQVKFLNHTLQGGNSPYAAMAYMSYAAILIEQGEIEEACRFGRLALDVAERFNAGISVGRMTSLYGLFIHHWEHPVRSGLRYFLKGYKACFEAGDFLYAALCLSRYTTYDILSGGTISDAVCSAAKYHASLLEMHSMRSIDSHRMLRQYLENLSGRAEDRFLLKGELWDEQTEVPKLIAVDERHDLFMYYATCKLPLLYLYDAYPEAVRMAEEGEKYLASALAQFIVPAYYFYYSLALLAHYPEVGSRAQEGYLRRVQQHQKKMNNWATHCPENFEHKYYLVEAELYGLSGDMERALRSYDRAIALAGRNEFLQEEALANERAARFCLSKGINTAAANYMRESRRLYALWGATGKVEYLEERYADLLPKIEEKKAASTDEKLDLTTVVQSLQAISTEIVPERLLDQLMKIVLENAGADRGFFISVEGGRLYIKAESVAGRDIRTTVGTIPVEKKRDLPASILNYVIKTGMHIVLDDAANEGDFSSDNVVRNLGPKSILALPVVRERKLVGILYLENGMATGAFTEDRIEILRLLASQAAISFENARLYDSVIQKERALQKSEEKYRLVSESTSDLIAVLTLEGRYAYVSPSHRQYGYVPGELMGMSVLDIIHPDDHELITRRIGEYSKTGGTRVSSGEFATTSDRIEFRIRTQSGSVRDLQSTVNVIFDRSGNPASLIAVSRDITERKNAEEAARSQQEQLFQAAKMASLGTLVSGVAHEINNPISSVMLNGPILQRIWDGVYSILDEYAAQNGEFKIAGMSYTELRERIPGLLAGITDGAKRVKSIVGDLKEFARQRPPELTDWVRIEEAANRAVGLVGNLIKKSTDRFTVFCEPGIPVFKGNTQRIEQVIINLLVNACQALSDRTQEVGMLVTHDPAVDCVIIEVRDQGSGMPPEVLKRIRDPFFTTKRQSGGTGLGLCISDRIVQDHRGTMSFESSPGKGTTVRVVLSLQETLKVDFSTRVQEGK